MPLRRLDFQAKTDVGLVRRNNEDSFLAMPEIGLFVVCDGLGGHAAGEVASQIAAETMQEQLAKQLEDPKVQLAEAIDDANARILEDQRLNLEHLGMGTTLSALWVPYEDDLQSWVGHVGDSRLYRLRGRQFDQVTDDHSPIFRLYKEGSLRKEDLRHHPQKNLIEKSLGLSMMLESEVFPLQAEKGDLYLLCTDGLSDYVSDEEIGKTLMTAPWEDICQELINKALETGGFDNITVITIRFD